MYLNRMPIKSLMKLINLFKLVYIDYYWNDNAMFRYYSNYFKISFEIMATETGKIIEKIDILNKSYKII